MAYYGDLPTYTKQLDALVDYVREHKDAADARFVLAYHNLMMGHSDAAKAQFEKVLAKVPQDQLAGGTLEKTRRHAAGRDAARPPGSRLRGSIVSPRYDPGDTRRGYAQKAAGRKGFRLETHFVLAQNQAAIAV